VTGPAASDSIPGCAIEACTDTIRSGNPRFLRILSVVPETRKPAVTAVLALITELQRIPDLIKEPMMGEIRYAWWREAIVDLGAGIVRGHPIVEALDAAGAQHDGGDTLLAIVEDCEDLWIENFPTTASEIFTRLETSAQLRFSAIAHALSPAISSAGLAAAHRIGTLDAVGQYILASQAEATDETSSLLAPIVADLQLAADQYIALLNGTKSEGIGASGVLKIDAAARAEIRPLFAVLASIRTRLKGRIPGPAATALSAFWSVARARV